MSLCIERAKKSVSKIKKKPKNFTMERVRKAIAIINILNGRWIWLYSCSRISESVRMLMCVYGCAPVCICTHTYAASQPYPYRMEIWSFEHRSWWWWRWWYSKICMHECVCAQAFAHRKRVRALSQRMIEIHIHTRTHNRTNRCESRLLPPHYFATKRYHTNGCCRRSAQNLNKKKMK